jgi:hypothetical protein
MQSISSTSILLDVGAGPGQKIRLIVSILTPPGWRLISQNSRQSVYERIATGDEGGATKFEIRAFTSVESR